MNPGISTFIAVGVIVNIVATLWLIWWTAKSGEGKSAKETTHVWDGDLTEYNNPLPRWWLWLFIITIIFGFWYLWQYPGLGSFAGAGKWTSQQQWQAEDDAAAAAFKQRFAAFEGKSLADLSKDAGAMATARNLFALNCSTCHGSDARGAKGFPNLTDNDWLWGGSEAAILQTITNGRDGVMPPWGQVLGNDGLEQVIAYVMTLSGRQAPAEAAAAGKARFEAICSACHGMDGKGNQALGAPNLTDDVWLHGGSVKDLRETIANGRTNHMPAHLERLGETKVRLLAAYVLSLSQPTAAGGQNGQPN
ncbi:MAG: cytochrome-c oxidase, cbb3-type subunit III [Steroidobacteraceae bacterium]